MYFHLVCIRVSNFFLFYKFLYVIHVHKVVNLVIREICRFFSVRGRHSELSESPSKIHFWIFKLLGFIFLLSIPPSSFPWHSWWTFLSDTLYISKHLYSSLQENICHVMAIFFLLVLPSLRMWWSKYRSFVPFISLRHSFSSSGYSLQHSIEK